MWLICLVNYLIYLLLGLFWLPIFGSWYFIFLGICSFFSRLIYWHKSIIIFPYTPFIFPRSVAIFPPLFLILIIIVNLFLLYVVKGLPVSCLNSLHFLYCILLVHFAWFPSFVCSRYSLLLFSYGLGYKLNYMIFLLIS